MAECSYARCLQERRLIKNELKRWSKDMLITVGLERVAEELMGGRKWKHFQDTLTRTHLNIDHSNATAAATATTTTTIEQYNCNNSKNNSSEPNTVKLDISNLRNDLNTITTTTTTTTTTKEQQSYQENHRQQEEENVDFTTGYSIENTDGINFKLKQQQHQHTITETKEEATTSHNQIIQENNNNNNISNNNNNSCISSLNLSNNITNAITTTTTATGTTTTAATLLASPLTTTTATTTTAPIEQPPPEPESEPKSEPDPEPEPVDWKPNDKCYFCVNGKLLTVNSKGELEAESGPAMSEADHAHKLETDSDSNESTPVHGASGRAGSLTENNRFNFQQLLTSRLRDLPANMTSIDPIAPHLAALQRINWLQYAQHQQQQPGNSVTPTTSEISAAAISPSLKDSPSPSDVTGEQPLDLSSKPSPNSSISGDLKNVRTRSSRSTPVPPAARRTYSDEDLNKAVQDILNGKLGTRKAAVQYSVPRSTLRNKVNKLTMEARRNNGQAPIELLQDLELSGDEGDDSNASTPQPDVSTEDLLTPTLRKLCENNGNAADKLNNAAAAAAAAANVNASPKADPELLKQRHSDLVTGVRQPQTSPQPQVQPILFDPTGFLQTLLSVGGLGETVRLQDLFRALLVNPPINLNDILTAALSAARVDNVLNNGQAANLAADRQMLLHQLQQQQQQPQVSPFAQRLANSVTPETASSLDANEAYEDPSAILKIPSFKPAVGAGTAGPSGSPALNANANTPHARNGDSPHTAPSNSISVISPSSLLHHHRALSSGGADSQSPPTRSFSDAIADSIHRSMNEQSKEAHAAASMLASVSGAGGVNVDLERNDYKKPSISVVKNIGGTDTSRFGSAPNLLAPNPHNSHLSHHHPHSHRQSHLSQHHSHHALSQQDAAALAAGKGTRPKRGKYRNYDRDSLVEAVKAVQRGEMSVHRAGSYYGVPHSTLEYKVKERHLMRPRKREPKPQPGLDGASGSSATAGSSKSNANIPNINHLDKLKSGSQANKLKHNNNNNNSSNNNNSAYTNAAVAAAAAAAAGVTGAPVNGMKLPIFDPAFAYQSQLFWSHQQGSPFGQLPLDFNRNAAAAAAAVSSSNAGNILKSHIQRYQEGPALRTAGATTSSPSPLKSSSRTSGDGGVSGDYAEGMYEIGSANGSSSAFVEGIIRKTLNFDVTAPTSANSTNSGVSGGALLDQLLVKKTGLSYNNNNNNKSNNNNNNGNNYASTSKRPGSPLPYTEIKRERTSPLMHSSDDDSSQSCSADDMLERNNNNKSKSNVSGNDNSSARPCNRMTSHDGCDSETDASSLKSELRSHAGPPSHNHHHQQQQHQHQQHHHNKIVDLNGGNSNSNSSIVGVTKLESTSTLPPTSILQEKLAQIKSEQESEEHL